MVTVEINGEVAITDTSAISTMGDLIELVKATIDPETIITDLKLAGKNLSDTDWRVPLSVQGTSTLEVTTGSRDAYIIGRLHSAPELLEAITEEFDKVKDCFKDSMVEKGNKLLGTAVGDLDAFIKWYEAILAMLTEEVYKQYEDSLEKTAVAISATCEQLVQQQLYQSWWALGETIESKLIPELKAFTEATVFIAEDLS